MASTIFVVVVHSNSDEPSKLFLFSQFLTAVKVINLIASLSCLSLHYNILFNLYVKMLEGNAAMDVNLS